MTDSEILKYAIECGMIDRTSVEHRIEMQNKQKYLEMHKNKVWQGKDGKWYTFLPCEDRRRLIKRGDRSALNDAIAGYYKVENEDPTFEELFKSWLNDKLKCDEICKGTYDRYIQDYERFIKGTSFSRKKIKNITENDIEDLVRDNIAAKDLKRKSFAGMRTVIMGVFKYAKRRRYTDLSISAFFKDLDLSKRMFKRDVKNAKDQVFSEDETPILLDYLEKNPSLIHHGIRLCFMTGLRTGELVALKFSDLEDDSLHIQRQQIRYKDANGRNVYEIVDYTKTDDGNRYVYIPKKALAIIKQIRLLNPFSEYMFPGIKKHNFNNHLYRACARCGVAPRSMHKIRKTYGTTLIDSGVDDSLIMSQMGHKDIQTTRSYYYFARKNNEHKKNQIENAVNY